MTDVSLPPAYDWREVNIPGGTGPVSLARLSVDRDSGATQSLVQFPAGWSRPSLGWYSEDEEILVIEGTLQMSGATYSTGGYAYVPAGYLRSSTSVGSGCLVLAWFSGRPTWHEDNRHGQGYDEGNLVEATWTELPVELGPLGAGRRLREKGSRTSWILENEDRIKTPTKTDLFSLGDRTWAQVPSGTRGPKMLPPVFARAWSAK